jgi:hypothetical protein
VEGPHLYFHSSSQELSKYTWTEHPDHDQLKLATASIAQIAEEGTRK